MFHSSIRKQARILMWLITVPFAGLVLLTLLLVGNVALQALWRGAGFAENLALGLTIYYLPMLLYMWAIWMVRQALRSVAAGELFDYVVPKLLARVGIALLCGALFKEVIVPFVRAVLGGRPHVQTFEASAVTLGVVGASLVVFAQLLARAAKMREELREFV
jgi:Protein of unknown function (DUF2975)